MEISSQTLTIAVSIIAVLIAAVGYWQSGRPLTLQGLTETAKSAGTIATELYEVAFAGSQLAQEMKRTGKITSGSEAEKVAAAYVKKFYPDVDEETVLQVVNAAYFGVQALGVEMPDLTIVERPPGPLGTTLKR